MSPPQHQYSTCGRSLNVTHRRTWIATCRSSLWHTWSQQSLAATSHLEVRSRGSPSLDSLGQFGGGAEMARCCHQPQHPDEPTGPFSPVLNLEGEREGKKRKDKETLGCKGAGSLFSVRFIMPGLCLCNSKNLLSWRRYFFLKRECFGCYVAQHAGGRRRVGGCAFWLPGGKKGTRGWQILLSRQNVCGGAFFSKRGGRDAGEQRWARLLLVVAVVVVVGTGGDLFASHHF